MKKFIADAKKDIDLQAKILIESAKKWQQNANEKFDLIQLHINREHNLQNSSTTASNEERPIQRPTERRIGRPPKPPTERSSKKPSSQPKKVCFPSMPGKQTKFLKKIIFLNFVHDMKKFIIFFLQF